MDLLMSELDPASHALWFLPINVFPVIQWLLWESCPEHFHQGYFFHPTILAISQFIFQKGKGLDHVLERKILQGPKHLKSMG